MTGQIYFKNDDLSVSYFRNSFVICVTPTAWSHICIFSPVIVKIE